VTWIKGSRLVQVFINQILFPFVCVLQKFVRRAHLSYLLVNYGISTRCASIKLSDEVLVRILGTENECDLQASFHIVR
jgi:hypothetical protein